jgi:hypothetical protein
MRHTRFMHACLNKVQVDMKKRQYMALTSAKQPKASIYGNYDQRLNEHDQGCTTAVAPRYLRTMLGV